MTNLAHLPKQNDANSVVAANIRAELGLLGRNQAALAKHLGENEMWLSRRMRSNPPFNTNEVAVIADYFGVTVGDLFTRRDRPNRPVNDVKQVGAGRITRLEDWTRRQELSALHI